MATLADKRAWLREYTSEDVPSRGRLRPDLVRLYDDAHPDDTPPEDLPDDRDRGGWDLSDDEFAADFLNADEEDLEPSVPMQPERPPRTARTARAARRAEATPAARTGRLVGSLLGGGKGKAPPRGKGKPPPRMSLEKFVTRGYSTLGRMVAPLSQPMSRCLQAQAVMAGVIFEDMARHTMADRILQPMARAEDKLDKGFALVAPPLIVLAIEQTQASLAAGGIDQQQAMVRMAFLQPILRESLRIGLEVSESYADQMKARIEQESKWDTQVDELISVIFGMPQPVPEPAAA
jgi:hypothetical protein